jgi:hypothetical protein
MRVDMGDHLMVVVTVMGCCESARVIWTLLSVIPGPGQG